MTLKLDNGVTLELEGGLEVSIGQDGKTVSVKASQSQRSYWPITTPAFWPIMPPYTVTNGQPAEQI